MEKIINEKVLNLNLFDTIERYPFNGRSKYLIDKFYIIGFEYDLIHKLIIENQIKDILKIEEKNELNNSDFNDLIGSRKIQSEELKSLSFPDTAPTLLNEISSDFNKQMPEIEVIINMIFPTGCEFFYSVNECTEEDNNKRISETKSVRTTITSTKSELGGKKSKQKTPKPYNVVFSYNPQEGNNSKKSINGFSFVFYQKHLESKIIENKRYTFYIPYTFCILSEFPFYNSYYLLCNQLFNLIKSKKVEIPLELIIYNIVNFTPSPLNCNVFLNLEAFNLIHDNISSGLGEIKEEDCEIELGEEENINKDTEVVNDKGNNLNNKKTKDDIVPLIKKKNSDNLEKLRNTVKSNREVTDIHSRFMSSSTIFSITKSKPFQKIKFGLLSGYPLIQYNLAKVLLDKMDPADVIIIFFYTFLEKSIIFFSKNIELLSLTINSYLNLNFPLNDEKYYFYNVSISYKDYMVGNSMFIGTTFTNVIGINSKYQSNYKNNHVRLAEHLTVDLDKGVIYQMEDERENDNNERDEKIFDFFKHIFKNKEMKETEKNSILYKEVKNIYEKLCFYKELFLKKNIKEKPDEYKKVVNGSYIYYDDHEDANEETKTEKNTVKYINRDIQESFYILVNNLCIYFYQNLSLKSHEDQKIKTEENDNKKDSMMVIFNDELILLEKKYIPEELDFLAELRETMKFQSFVFGFIQSYNPIDLYKIPLSFTEEFLSMISAKSSIYNKNKNYIKFLSIIDSIYNKSKRKSINIEFSQFINEYFQKYKYILDREIYDNHDSDKLKVTLKDDDYNENIIIDKMRYFTFKLNNNIIFQYKYLLDNLNRNDYESLLVINENTIKENIIQKIMISDIENSIEKTLMEIGLITSSDICFSNIIFLFTISLKQIIKKFDYQIFLSSLFKQCTVFRKYYTMLIEIIYKLMKNNLENKQYQDAENYLMSYYLFINSLRSLGLVPNENLINIIKKFHKMSVDELHKADSNNKIKKNREEDNKEENNFDNINFVDNYIYICKNFTYEKFIKEKQILKDINHIHKKNKGQPYSLSNRKGKAHRPKIKFNNREMKFEFKLYSQMEIFELLSREYVIYLSSNLDEQFLTIEEIFPICLNIIIYFRNMKEFEGKEEINNGLIEIYDLYLKLFSQKLKLNKKDAIN